MFILILGILLIVWAIWRHYSKECEIRYQEECESQYNTFQEFQSQLEKETKKIDFVIHRLEALPTFDTQFPPIRRQEDWKQVN